jgi:large subunit ribosomal protein L3
MWQVARQGQMGYHSRTEFNKKIMKIGTKPEDIKDINPKSGFKKYGNVKTTFVLISGSLPGPVKRAVSFRIPMRKPKIDHLKIEAIDFIGTSQKESKLIIGAEKQKIKAAEEKKEEKKSVADEIAAAVKGEKK